MKIKLFNSKLHSKIFVGTGKFIPSPVNALNRPNILHSTKPTIRYEKLDHRKKSLSNSKSHFPEWLILPRRDYILWTSLITSPILCAPASLARNSTSIRGFSARPLHLMIDVLYCVVWSLSSFELFPSAWHAFYICVVSFGNTYHVDFGQLDVERRHQAPQHVRIIH